MYPSKLNNLPGLIILIAMLIFVSLIPLGVSTLNLTEFYLMFDRGLPHPFTIGLAVALEAFAILSGFVTTTIGKAIGPCPIWITTASALLVWAGNAFVMRMAVPALPWYVPFCTASFAPMFTAGLGAGLGVLFALLSRVTREQTAAESSAIHGPTCRSRSGLDR